MKRHVLLVFTVVLLLARCQSVPLKIPVAPKQVAETDTWCRYTIKQQTGCDPSVDRSGQGVCVLCSSTFASNQLCPGELIIVPSEGCEYKLKALDPGQQQCENCTSGVGLTYQKASQPGVP